MSFGQLKKVYSLALEHFQGDRCRARLWMRIDNPQLKWSSPQNYVKRGYGSVLIDKMEEVKREQEAAKTIQ